MAMSSLDFWNGVVLTIFCVISLYVGLRIMSKYFKYKQRQLLFAGIVWMSLASPWLPACISFLMFLLIGESLTIVPYLIIGVLFIPLAFTLWIVVFADLVIKKQKKIILGVSISYGIIMEILLIYFIATDPSVIGVLKGETDIQYNIFMIIFALVVTSVALITGSIFSLKSMKSENPEIKLKGKLLLIAFICFSVGTTLDALLPLSWITFPIYRSLEILAAICFYGGFTLPNWMKKLFIRQENVENAIP